MAVSNLVTTGGLSTSDLISETRWTLLTSQSFASAAQTQTISGLSSYNYRKLKIVYAGRAGASTGAIALRINGDTGSVYQYHGLCVLGTGTAPYTQSIAHNYAMDGTGYMLTLYDAQQYGYLNHIANGTFLGEIEISNANNTDNKHIKSISNYLHVSNYSANLKSSGLYFPSSGAVISSVSLYNTNTTLGNGGWGYGMKLYGAN